MDFESVERTKWVAYDYEGYAPVAVDNPSLGDDLEAIRITVDATAFDALLLAYKEKCAELENMRALTVDLSWRNIAKLREMGYIIAERPTAVTEESK